MSTPTRPAGHSGFWADAWSVARNLILLMAVVLAAGVAVALITQLIALPLRLLHWLVTLVRV